MMNERILEAAFQSLFINKRVSDGSYFIDDPELMTKLEKFAELIVRECINIAYEYDAPKMSGPGMIIAGRIEEHFGVEE